MLVTEFILVDTIISAITTDIIGAPEVDDFLTPQINHVLFPAVFVDTCGLQVSKVEKGK